MEIFEILDRFVVNTVDQKMLFFGLFGVLGVALFASFFTLTLKNIFLAKPFDTLLSDFIPLEKILDDGKTILCSDGSIARVFKIDGINASFLTVKRINGLISMRKNWIDSLSEKDVNARVFTIRERLESPFKTEHSIDILKKISEKWDEKNKMVFQNSHYIVLSMENNKKAYDDIVEVSDSLKAILDEYGVKLLDKDDYLGDTPLSPFIKILNPISKPNLKVEHFNLNGDISEFLTSEEVLFSNKGNIVFRSGEQEKFMAVIGTRTISDFADEQMLSDLLALNYEINILQNFVSIPKLKAQALLMNQKRMSMSTSFSYDVVGQYDEALSLIEQGDEDHQTLVDYAQTFFIYADSEEKLDKAVLEAQKIFRLYGVIPVRENWVAQASWFSQFPTYDKFPRVYRVLSGACAHLINFEKQPKGFVKSDWGEEPVTIFPTAQGTAYQFQFHVSESQGAVGHTVAIGPTGQGKTTLYAFLAGQAMKYDKLKTFFFDRHRGAEIFTHAVGGDYINFAQDTTKIEDKVEKKDLSSGRTVNLNPFKIDDSSENRAFLRRWLKEITLVNDAKSEAEIGRAITTVFDYLDLKDRNLKTVYKSAFSPTGKMRKELARWVDDNQYGKIFNGKSDNLNLSNRFNTFDFTHILQDNVLAPAIVSYIMNRIQNLTGKSGDPSLIIIDETAPMLSNPLFRQNFVVGMQEGRKKRQVYVTAFQQPNIIDKLGIGELMRGQAQTEIFFRNPQASEEDYKDWRLTTKEFAFISGKTFRDLKYAILLRKPSIGESVILNVDISGIGEYIQLYNSGRKHVVMAEELRKQFDGDFVKHYLRKFT